MQFDLVPIVLDLLGITRQNRVEYLHNGAVKSDRMGHWKTWITHLSMNTCFFCFEQRGKILDLDVEEKELIPVHTNCRCETEVLEVIQVGTATKDGQNGADVSLFYNHQLPDNYITKKDARSFGWKPILGNLWKVADGKSIGGDIFYNDSQKLPEKLGRVWYECDINYYGGYRNNSRLLYSNDGLVFVTYDHYQTFFEIGV